MSHPKKAIVLLSGGLDSALAAKILLTQGVWVEGIHFFTGFCMEGNRPPGREKRKAPIQHSALRVAEVLGIKLHFIDISEEYKDVLLAPKHGYGRYLNPCLDCKIMMMRKTRDWIEANQFDFIATGEVLGQRPMSQRKVNLRTVIEESGVGDLLLRPLSAKALAPTKPEQEGWVNRDQLYDFHGRDRNPQLALARELGLTGYSQPAGGCCFLTDPNYAARLNDLWQARGSRDYELDDVILLKLGRHIRPRPYFKLIVGRNEGENHFLEGYRKRFLHLKPLSHQGPLVLLDGILEQEDDKQLAAALTARFSQGRDLHEVEVEIVYPDQSSQRMQVKPIDSEEIPTTWYI